MIVNNNRVDVNYFKLYCDHKCEDEIVVNQELEINDVITVNCGYLRKKLNHMTK